MQTFKEKHSFKNMRPIQYVIDGECWVNSSHVTDKDGYGVVKRKGKKVLHRYIAAEHYGVPYKSKMVCMHTCNNKRCINPDHLEFGTTKQNVHDAYKDGLSPIGSKHHNAKLNESEAAEIKLLLQRNDVYQKDIASMFGVDPGTIRDIKKGRVWKHVQVETNEGNDLTIPQQRVFTFIVKYKENHGKSPAIHEISEGIGLIAKSAAHRHLVKLREKGFIDWDDYEVRSIRIVKN